MVSDDKQTHGSKQLSDRRFLLISSVVQQIDSQFHIEYLPTSQQPTYSQLSAVTDMWIEVGQTLPVQSALLRQRMQKSPYSFVIIHRPGDSVTNKARNAIRHALGRKQVQRTVIPCCVLGNFSCKQSFIVHHSRDITLPDKCLHDENSIQSTPLAPHKPIVQLLFGRWLGMCSTTSVYHTQSLAQGAPATHQTHETVRSSELGEAQRVPDRIQDTNGNEQSVA